MKVSKQSRSLVIALVLACGAALASAQTADKTSTDMQDESHKSMPHDMANMPNMHKMPATVTAVDSKTGVVDVNAEGMALKVHFPASTVANLKAGDKITLHLGFSKE